MGRRRRFEMAGVVSLAAALPFAPLFACDEGTTRPDVFPTEGGPSSPGARDGKAAVDGEAPRPDAGDGGPTCDPLAPLIDVRNVAADPNPAPNGGVIPDGTYQLTAALFADSSGDGGVVFKRAAFMKFAGKDVVWHSFIEGGDEPATCCVGTWAYDATTRLRMSLTCASTKGTFERTFDEIYDVYPTGVPDAGIDSGGAPQVMLHLGSLHDVYTKQ